MKTAKLFLVDDHALLRDLLMQVFERDTRFDVVGCSDSADALVAEAQRLSPDIVLLDIDMPGIVSFDAAQELLRVVPDCKIVFLSAYFHDHYIEQALRVGALGYITKDEPPARVVEALASVLEGKAYFSDTVLKRIVFEESGPRLSSNAHSRAYSLTPRELQVLRYLARGLAKKEVARIFDVSVKTIDKHTENLMRKLAINDRVELARFAIREGLSEP